jgi:hypothetical protein
MQRIRPTRIVCTNIARSCRDRTIQNTIGITLVDTKIVRQTSFVVLGDGPLDRDEPDTGTLRRGEVVIPDMID